MQDLTSRSRKPSQSHSVIRCAHIQAFILDLLVPISSQRKPKRGEFSPDFFIKQVDQVFVVEVKGDEEIADPSADNIKKHEYATDHFKRLNQWLEKAKIPTRYQFNLISPKSYNVFFQKLRDGGVIGFRSDLDVAMTKAAKAAS